MPKHTIFGSDSEDDELKIVQVKIIPEKNKTKKRKTAVASLNDISIKDKEQENNAKKRKPNIDKEYKNKKIDDDGNRKNSTTIINTIDTKTIATNKESETTKSTEKNLKKGDKHGGYAKYYGKRKMEKTEEGAIIDVRLSILQRDWFYDKVCLDIGCNTGLFTKQIAREFECKSMTGVDMDRDLIWKAKKHNSDVFVLPTETLAEIVNNHSCSNTNKMKKEEDKDKEEDKVEDKDKEEDKVADKDKEEKKDPHSKKIQFYRQDIAIHDHHCPDVKYDVITCFSVTKWIHLLNGDIGLKNSFKKIYKLLKPGGRFIVEPQMWKSYRGNRNNSEITKMHFKHIELKPLQFEEYLLSEEIGFTSCTDLGIPVNAAKGFDRKIFMYIK